MTEEEIEEFQEKHKHLIGKDVDVTVKSVKLWEKDISKECSTDSPYENEELKEFKNYTFEGRRLYSIGTKFSKYVEFSQCNILNNCMNLVHDIHNVIEIKQSKNFMEKIENICKVFKGYDKINFSFSTYEEFINHPLIKEKIKECGDNFDCIAVSAWRNLPPRLDGIKRPLPIYLLGKKMDYLYNNQIGMIKFDVPELPTFAELAEAGKLRQRLRIHGKSSC